jgi:hypothetical protein
LHSQSPGSPAACVVLPNCSILILKWHFRFYQSLFQLSPNYIKIIPSFIISSIDKKIKCRTQNCGNKLPIFIVVYSYTRLHAYITIYSTSLSCLPVKR